MNKNEKELEQMKAIHSRPQKGESFLLEDSSIYHCIKILTFLKDNPTRFFSNKIQSPYELHKALALLGGNIAKV